MKLFWETIANYNGATWIMQIVITLCAAVLTFMLYRKQSPRRVLAMKIFLIFVSAWIAIVYYMIYCYSRNYSIAFAIFWGVVCALWIYDAFWVKSQFVKNSGHRRIAIAVFILPLFYPVVSMLRGMSFPEMTSLVMPCTVAVFSIAVLLAFVKEVNLFFLMLMFHWTVIGLFKVHHFGIPEDLLTAAATIPALYIFFKDYVNARRDAIIKPDIRYIRALVDIICAIIAVGFFFVLYTQVKVAL